MTCKKCGKELLEGGICPNCDFSEQDVYINGKPIDDESIANKHKYDEAINDKTYIEDDDAWIVAYSLLMPVVGWLIAAGLIARNDDTKAKKALLYSFVSCISYIVVIVIIELIINKR